MKLLDSILKRWQQDKGPVPVAEPAVAYNLWSRSYDAQTDNLMLALDEEIFSGLLSKLTINNKVIVDVGCGTGRHWNKVLSRTPLALYGYDVSEGMLEKLKNKFPGALAYILRDDKLHNLDNNFVDILISTLTIAHIENTKDAIREWRRVLKSGGDVIITDFHPDALALGGKRTFTHNGSTFAVKNFVHPIAEVVKTFEEEGFEVLHMTERVVDNSMKRYYERKQAMNVYERFKNVPIIFGIHLRKKHALT